MRPGDNKSRLPQWLRWQDVLSGMLWEDNRPEHPEKDTTLQIIFSAGLYPETDIDSTSNWHFLPYRGRYFRVFGSKFELQTFEEIPQYLVLAWPVVFMPGFTEESA